MIRHSLKILTVLATAFCSLNACGGGAESPQNRQSAQDHARALSRAAHVYATDHEQKYPYSVAVIVAANSVNMDQLLDPRTARTPMAQPPGGSDPKAIEADVEPHTDFYYTGRNGRNETDAEIILFYDKGTFDSRIVSFGDAHSAEFMVGSAEMKKAVETHNAKRAKNKLAEVPADLAGPPKY
jgi:hypothetical protein